MADRSNPFKNNDVISELRGDYIDNHTSDLQFAIQSTILILKLLSIGASDCATCVI